LVKGRFSGVEESHAALEGGSDGDHCVGGARLCRAHSLLSCEFGQGVVIVSHGGGEFG